MPQQCDRGLGRGGGLERVNARMKTAPPTNRKKIITVTLKPQNKATPVPARVLKSAYLTHCAVQLK